ncbi:MAG: hypothetical protein A3J62_00375 [Candidatus Buchananbacteria bacterium RIFCSPHIGHO2_02_FULL_38_8]|uniref:Uncharacterized protein n=2 Tax=Candidatus Buchananiibacteriota TaxID=1817903 RepID=A0A1G1XTN4_9BACT|nr:MAG: hypothetical protein A2731_02230 [Candidatus Buchananbacteria bacterium RIFCSPHIGHO2_01_FULL_39_8]OGY47985.1 MAG: hypothetical protein A3J62_00375 [Candidatus Buchananbacteria bacterium RIFCSPHIGHO2_02_FULL_38_8]
MASIDNKKEKSKKKKVTFSQFLIRYYKLVITLLVVLIGVGGYYLLEPKYQAVTAEGRYKLDLLREEKQNRTSYLRDLKILMENYNEISQDEVERLNQVLPNEKDIPGLFVQLQALAEEQGFILTSVNISQAASAKDAISDKIKRLNVSLNLIGRDYDSLKEFLDLIEYNLRLFDVNAVYFSPDSEGYAINLFTYYSSN